VVKREALTFGIDKQVQKLTQAECFFKNELVKNNTTRRIAKSGHALRKNRLRKFTDEGLKGY